MRRRLQGPWRANPVKVYPLAGSLCYYYSTTGIITDEATGHFVLIMPLRRDISGGVGGVGGGHYSGRGARSQNAYTRFRHYLYRELQLAKTT